MLNPNHIAKITVVFLSLTLVSCGLGRKSESGSHSVSVHIDAVRASLAAQRGIGIATAPTNLSDFSCFLLNVTGANIQATSNLGIISAPISVSSGGAMTVTVPKANGLRFEVVGATSSVGCPAGAGLEDFLSTTSFPKMAVVGSVTADIQGDTELTIQNSYSATSAKELRTGSSFGGGVGDAPVRPEGKLSMFSMQTQEVPVTLQAAAAAEIASKLYIIGGKTTGGLNSPVSTIYQAAIDSNGDLGPITASNYSLVKKRAYPQAQVIGSYLYVFGGETDQLIGGCNSAAHNCYLLDSIERAPIDSSGISGPFEVITPKLDVGRSSFAILVTKNKTTTDQGYIYVMGGRDFLANDYDNNTVGRAPLNTSTGEITGDFTTLTRTVISAGQEVKNGMIYERATHGGFRLGDNFYILGGEGREGDDPSGADRYVSIEKVVIQNNGTISNFTKDSATLAQGRNRLSIVALSGKAYAWQGHDGHNFMDSVEEANIVNDELQSFSTMPSNEVKLSLAVENAVSLLTNTAVYVIGGYNGAVQKKIQKSAIVPIR